MRSTEHADVTDGPWAPYRPDDASPWNLRRVVHLHRRAGFAANWADLQRDLAEGPEKSIGRLLNGRCEPLGGASPEEFERTSTLLADSAVAAGELSRLKAWWFYRMLFSPDPLGERLTLMWHNHFATGNFKVQDPAAMQRQNALFRSLARAPFGELLDAAVRDPAILLWLDAPANRKGHPNENLARELMELFGLGFGHFSEADVKGAARALTGWTVVDGALRIVPSRHDDGPKTVLGRSGNWSGADVVRIIIEHPATAHRLAWRLCDTFMGEGGVERESIGLLGELLRRNHLDVGLGVSTILRSRVFFAERNMGTRIQGPVEFVVAPVHALELLDPPTSTLVLAEWCTRLGQDLFNPPNVGGWPGGRGWLSSRSLVGRAAYAEALAAAKGVGREDPLAPIALARKYAHGPGRPEVLSFSCRLLLGIEPDHNWIERLDEALGHPADWNEALARRAVVQIITSAEGHLA